jgi:hypothetical protein
MSQAQPAAQPAQPSQQGNPLDQLRDIHLPEQLDQFPIAIGWWILLAVVIFFIGYALYRLMKYKKSTRLLKPANIEIAALRNLKQVNAHAIATLSALLKRVCLVYFPHKNVASLNGEAWLNFLNQQSQKDEIFFSHEDIHIFTQSAYQANSIIDSNEWTGLLDASERCIETIIKTAAKNANKKIKETL